MGKSLWLRELSPDLDWCEEETRVRAFGLGELTLEAASTHYVFAHRGIGTLSHAGSTFSLTAGMFAALPGASALRGSAETAGLVISHRNYLGMFHLGGPIEARGRLRYIDGCTDTLLVSPLIQGDPCLNHLHIPAGTSQTRHLHPSMRVGMILRGEGICVTEGEELSLRPGLAFMIGKDVLHNFRTSTSSLDVVVYHPDSDTGPTHEDHPMLNRTLIR